MKILLTGATGLIGKELGKILVSRGHQIISVSRNSKKAKNQLPFPTQILEWSGMGEFPKMDLSSIDGVIHLMGESIAESRWSEQVKKQLINSRVQSTRSLKKAIDQNAINLKFWIQGSAIGYYGESKKNNIFDESSPLGRGFLSELCQEWENALLVTEVPSLYRKVTLRTGVVISHQGGALPKMMDPLMAGIGGVIGSGEQRMSVIHLIDLVGFIVHAVENEQISGPYNLVSEHPVSQKDFIHCLCSKLSIPAGLSVPEFAIKLAMGKMGSLLLQDQAVVSNRLSESGFEFKYPLVDQILEEVIHWYENPFKSTGKTFPTHLFYSEQFVPFSVEKAFTFFSEAKNLEKITPPWLHFNILAVSTPQIQKNTKIRYQLKLHGIPLKWVTDIAEWEPNQYFVDNQLSGPYHLWYHQHSFEAVSGGTLMKDWVRFQLPLGKAGMVGLPKVYADVRAIFTYRTSIIEELISHL